MHTGTVAYPKPIISVVIPSYNRRDCLLRLMEDVQLQQGVEFEVIVVDDCSSDGSVEAVTTTYPEVKMIVNNANSGCSITRNRGIRAARGGIIIGLDSDVSLPDRDLFMKVCDTFDHSPGICGLAFRIYDAESSKDDYPRWWHAAPVDGFADKHFKTDYFSGTAFAFRRDSLAAAGFFPEHIFQYYEEVELAYRIMDNDGVIEYSPRLTIMHHPGARNGWSEHRYYHNPRSQILMAYSCYPAGKAAVFLLTRLGRSFLKALAARKVGVYTAGIASGIAGIVSKKLTRKPLKEKTWRRIKAIKSGPLDEA